MVDLNGEPTSCDICGRSMLAGERTRTYVTRDREEREVCDLCVVRAESADWVPRELAGAAVPERREVGGAVKRLFGRAREGAAGIARSVPQPREEAAAAEAANGNRAPAVERPRRQPPPARERAPEEAPPRVAERPVEQRPRRRSVPQNPERRIRRALEYFNASEYKQTVRSLIRSLGGPYVCAATDGDAPNEVRITIAWELSWYQYEVDLTAEGDAVRELGRGDELSDLAAEDREWNAHAAEDGELRPGLIGSEAAG